MTHRLLLCSVILCSLRYAAGMASKMASKSVYDSFLGQSVVSIDRLEQLLKIDSESKRCDNQIQRERNESIFAGRQDTYCPTEFDSIMCWPRTPPNAFARLPCPDYIDGFVLNKNASRFCTQNGTWYRRPGLNVSWTNLTLCPRKSNPVGERHFTIINMIGHIGYAVSALSLTTAIFIMIYFKRLHCPRNTVHINLFSAFLLRAFANFLSLAIIHNENWLCKLFFTFHNYAIQASYSWICIEAIYLHNVIFIHVMSEESNYHLFFYIVAGWSTPFVVCLIWALLRLTYDDSYCWNRRQQDDWNRAYWFTMSYSILLVMTNLAIFINIIRVIFVKMRHEPTADRYRKLARSTMVLVVVFGIYYIVFIPLDLLEASHLQITSIYLEIAKLYYQHTLSTFQGFLVSLLFCFVNAEVLYELRRFLARHFFLPHDTRAFHSTQAEDFRSGNSACPAASKRRNRGANLGVRRLPDGAEDRESNSALMRETACGGRGGADGADGGGGGSGSGGRRGRSADSNGKSGGAEV